MSEQDAMPIGKEGMEEAEDGEEGVKRETVQYTKPVRERTKHARKSDGSGRGSVKDRGGKNVHDKAWVRYFCILFCFFGNRGLIAAVVVR